MCFLIINSLFISYLIYAIKSWATNMHAVRNSNLEKGVLQLLKIVCRSNCRYLKKKKRIDIININMALVRY